jgi:hypothetical protein
MDPRREDQAPSRGVAVAAYEKIEYWSFGRMQPRTPRTDPIRLDDVAAVVKASAATAAATLRRNAMRIVVALLSLVACHPDWDGKAGWRRCQPAIASGERPPSCRAMNMCANEAPLTTSERATLTAMMSDAGCPPP